MTLDETTDCKYELTEDPKYTQADQLAGPFIVQFMGKRLKGTKTATMKDLKETSEGKLGQKRLRNLFRSSCNR